MLALIFFIYHLKSVVYIVFCTIGVVWSSIKLIYTMFEQYKIDDIKIIHVYRFKKEEIYWKEIDRICISPNLLAKGIKISYGTFLNKKNLIICSDVKGFEELIDTILKKTKNNPNIIIDKRIYDIIE